MRRLSGMPDRQRRYWESGRPRRCASDPVIVAFVQPKIDFLLQHIRLPAGASVLDVGCGDGYFTSYLGQVGQTFGLDYARAMLKRNSNNNLLQGSAFALPFAARTFDLVFCSNLLHHIDDPAAVVGEMKRVSKEFVAIHEPNRNNPTMLALGLVKPEERQLLRFTRSYLHSLARQHGLHVLACASLGFVTPNRMPTVIARWLASSNRPHPLAAYTMLVARRND